MYLTERPRFKIFRSSRPIKSFKKKRVITKEEQEFNQEFKRLLNVVKESIISEYIRIRDDKNGSYKYIKRGF